MREGAWAYVAVAVGAMLGALARAGTAALMIAWLGPGFPWGTLAANVAGSFAIGLFATLSEAGGRLAPASPATSLFIATGLCGGFTTFSIFSLESLLLLQHGRAADAGLYVAGSLVLWMAAAWAGWRLGARLNRAPRR